MRQFKTTAQATPSQKGVIGILSALAKLPEDVMPEENISLPIGQYQLCLTALEPIQFADYSGSAWRGIFGHSLKKIACVTRNTECPDCMLYRSCVYSYLFETPPPLNSAKLSRYPAAPHPYLLIPAAKTRLQKGEECRLGLTLFGHGNRHLAYVIHALKQAVDKGIGRESQRLQLDSVQQLGADGWQEIYTVGGALQPQPLWLRSVPAVPTSVTVTLHTPLRLRLEGKNIRPEALRFTHFFSSLLRRFSLLSYFHSDEALEVDFRALKKQAESVQFEALELRWQEWHRYSNRQRCLVPMGGVVGEFQINSSELAPLWPYLWLGQWLHTGKGSSMGLGRYSLAFDQSSF